MRPLPRIESHCFFCQKTDMILFRKNPSLLLHYLSARSKKSIVSTSSHFLTPFFFFNSKVEDPSPDLSFAIQYLIEFVGLSLEEATKTSKSVARIKTRFQPDSVLQLFRQSGFTDSNIKRIVCRHPKVLRANVDTTLKPKMKALGELGFSETQITKLITANPLALSYMNYCKVRPKIDFLRGFFGSKDNLVKALSYDISLLSRDLEKAIKPNIKFLKECQFSDARIGYMMTMDQKVMGRSLNSLKAVVQRVDKLGISRGSGMFYYAFRSVCKIKPDGLEAKLKLFGRLGFSEAEVLKAIQKQPTILNLSEKNLSETIKFLVKEAGCEASYVINRPTIIGLSLKRRLVPRNCVVQLLKAKGLLKKKFDYYTIMSLTDTKFANKFIIAFQKVIPELHHVYLSASAGKIPR